MSHHLLFLYLKAFSITGGIEKVNRVLLKALFEMQLQQLWTVTAASPYATTAHTNLAAAARQYNTHLTRILQEI